MLLLLLLMQLQTAVSARDVPLHAVYRGQCNPPFAAVKVGLQRQQGSSWVVTVVCVRSAQKEKMSRGERNSSVTISKNDAVA